MLLSYIYCHLRCQSIEISDAQTNTRYQNSADKNIDSSDSSLLRLKNCDDMRNVNRELINYKKQKIIESETKE